MGFREIILLFKKGCFFLFAGFFAGSGSIDPQNPGLPTSSHSRLLSRLTGIAVSALHYHFLKPILCVLD
jgi:hypothetical protein